MDDILVKSIKLYFFFFAKSIHLLKAISYVLWLNVFLYSAKLCACKIYTLEHDCNIILIMHIELTCPSVTYAAI